VWPRHASPERNEAGRGTDWPEADNLDLDYRFGIDPRGMTL
jgi:hypothetical protein